MSSIGPVILVTGASRGLGLAIVRVLLSPPFPPNVRVVTVSRSPLPSIPSSSDSSSDSSLASSHPHVTHLRADISSDSTPGALVDLAINTYGRIDGMVINHGVQDPVEKVAEPSSSMDEWRRLFDVNFFSAVGLLKAAMPELRKNKGKVIFVSSGAATNGYPGWGAYSASKAAMNSLCRTLGTEEPDITSIAVRPGVVDTDMQRDIRELHRDAMGEKAHSRFVNLHKAGRLLKPEQPGAVIANLAIKAPKEFSGQYMSWDAEELKEFRFKE